MINPASAALLLSHGGVLQFFLINIFTSILFPFLDLFLSRFKTAVSEAKSPATSAAIV